MNLKKWLSDLSLAKKLYLVMAVFLAGIIAMLILSRYATDIINTTRAYTEAEGIYVVKQDNAVNYLREYMNTHNEDDYKKFTDIIKSLSGYKTARIELEKPKPDFKAAYQGFIQGGNHPEDVKGMASMFRRFRNLRYMDKAIAMWTEADELVVELSNLGNEIHGCVLDSKDYSEADHLEKDLELYNKIMTIDGKIAKLGSEFSVVFCEVSHWAEKVLIWVMSLCALVIGIIGVLLIGIIVRNVITRARNIIQAMSETAKGDFSARIEAVAKDEIGIIASAFNKMAENLKDSQEKIQAQNEELSANNEELKAANKELESTSEELMQGKEELEAKNEELRLANEEAQKARETAEKKSAELERFNKLAVGRELEMREMKERIKELEARGR